MRRLDLRDLYFHHFSSQNRRAPQFANARKQHGAVMLQIGAVILDCLNGYIYLVGNF